MSESALTDAVIQELASKAKVTAFIDILGWGSLTGLPITNLIPKLATAAAEGKMGKLTSAETEDLKSFYSHFSLARTLDASLEQILTELNSFFEPELVSSRSKFFAGRYITIVKFSDSTFLYSTSLARVLKFISELFKRSLSKGILLRAGVSAGVVEHRMGGSILDFDKTLSVSQTIFGSGITSAVSSEKTGGGMRVFIHPELEHLLTDTWLPHITKDNQFGKKIVEFQWTHNIGNVLDDGGLNHLLTDWKIADIDGHINELAEGSKFSWNRKTADGKIKIDDTLDVLKSALDHLVHH